MRIRAEIPNKDLILEPGLFGRVSMPGSLPYQGILVPDDAIGADQDRRVVYVVDDAGKVTAKPVRLGPKLYGYRIIRSGLTGNEIIETRQGTRTAIRLGPDTHNIKLDGNRIEGFAKPVEGEPPGAAR